MTEESEKKPEPVLKRKRLVTGEQYVSVLKKKATLGGLGVFNYCICLIFICPGGYLLLQCLMAMVSGSFSPDRYAVDGIIGLLLAFTGFSLFLLGTQRFQESVAVEPVERINRHNIDQLPAEESLVRASTEPPQALQATVLLRPAQEGEQTPQEQLLRASGWD